jgi:hypothetical protein
VDPGQVAEHAGQARVAAPAHLPGARYFEHAGDHLLWLGDTDAMFGQIREFLGGAPGQETKTDRRSSSPAAPAAG